MPLPIVPLPTGSVVIGGETVQFHSMSRAAAVALSAYDDAGEAEIFILVEGVGVTEDEARNWRKSVHNDTAMLLINGIIKLSGLARKDADPKP